MMQLALMPTNDPRLIRLGESNEPRLAEYRVARLADGAAARTVEAEVGQLRSLVRDSVRIGGPATLDDIIDTPSSLIGGLMRNCRPSALSQRSFAWLVGGIACELDGV